MTSLNSGFSGSLLADTLLQRIREMNTLHGVMFTRLCEGESALSREMVTFLEDTGRQYLQTAEEMRSLLLRRKLNLWPEGNLPRLES